MSDPELKDYSPSSAGSSVYSSGQESPKHNNNFKTEPPPVISLSDVIFNNALSFGPLLDRNRMTFVDDPVPSNPYDLSPKNHIFDDIESIDCESSPNEVCGKKNEDYQELDNSDSFNMDFNDGFLKSLAELDDVLFEDETINVTQSCKVYECINRQDLRGTLLLTFEPKFKDFLLSDIESHDPSTYRIICDSEVMMLMSSYICEDMIVLTNDHLIVVLKCKEQV